jgi:hypothetical protein
MMLARRTMLHGLGVVASQPIGAARAAVVPGARPRVRPGDPRWPSPAMWENLNRAVGGRLIKVRPLLAPCEKDADSDGPAGS